MEPDIEQESAADDIVDEGGGSSHLCSLLRNIECKASVYFRKAIIYLTVIILLFTVAIVGVGVSVLSPLGLMILFSFHRKRFDFGVAEEVPDTSSLSVDDMRAVYAQSKRRETFSHRLMFGSFRLVARSGLLLLFWFLLNVSILRLKAIKLLGSPLWRWSLLAVVLTSSYFVAMAVYLLPGAFQTMIAKIIRAISRAVLGGTTHYSRPYLNLYSVFFPSATLSMYSGMVLLLWLFYFRTNRGLNDASNPHPEAFEYVTWTFVSLFVGSILLSLKTLLLFKWSVNAIYVHFQPKILITRVKFVYLGILVGGFFEEEILTELELYREYHRQSDLEPRSFHLTNYIMSRKVGMYYLQDAARLLISLQQVVTPLQEDGVPELLEFLKGHNFYQTEQECEQDEEDKVDRIIQAINQDHRLPYQYEFGIGDILLCLVREQGASEEKQLTFDDVNKWLVDAHINCVNMGRTLADAIAIVTRLDMIITIIISALVVLLWFLITGIATTAVLVTVATPFLAFTFIFGDSAKQFFQGIIFCFGTHAFDVGDRCILDDTELEVKNMGILTTTFIKIGTAEKRMYPNSELATKAIVNLGWKPDPSDIVELTLDYSTTFTEWQLLEKKVEEFFSDPQQKEFFQSWHEVMMKESEDKIKVIICFKHVLNVSEMTHGECLQKKNRQRSKILKKVNYFLNHTTSPTTTSWNDENGGSVVLPMIDPHQPSITSEIE